MRGEPAPMKRTSHCSSPPIIILSSVLWICPLSVSHVQGIALCLWFVTSVFHLAWCPQVCSCYSKHLSCLFSFYAQAHSSLLPPPSHTWRCPKRIASDGIEKEHRLFSWLHKRMYILSYGAFGNIWKALWSPTWSPQVPGKGCVPYRK